LSGLILFLILLIGFITACPPWVYSGEGEPPTASPPEKSPEAEIETPRAAEPGTTDPPPRNPDAEIKAPEAPKPGPASPHVPAPGQEQPAEKPETKPGGETKPNGEAKPGASIKAVFSGYELSLANVPTWLVTILAFVIIALFTAAFMIGRKVVSNTGAILGSISVVFITALAIALFGVIMYQGILLGNRGSERPDRAADVDRA
jgi:amino acid transporter